MLSGYMISVHNTLSTLLSVTWVPLFFLCFFSSIKNNNLNHAILAGVVGTVMFLGGGVEACYMAFGIAFFLTLFPGLVLEPDEFINFRRRMIFFSIFCALFFGLSAVQLIPFLELSALSIRDGGLPYAEAGTWSLHPRDLAEFFVPDLYGFASDFEKYWGYQNWLKSIYMGSFPFLLAIFYFKKLDRRALGFLLLILISLGLALGKHMPFHHFLYDYLPFFNKIRYPVKFIFLGVLVLCLAAGLGYDRFKKGVVDHPEKTGRGVKWVLVVAFISMLMFGILSFYNELFIHYLKTIGWDSPNFNKAEINLFHFKRFLAFTSLFCLCIFLYSTPRFQKRYILGILFSLMILDLFFAHYDHTQKAEWKRINQPGNNAEFLNSDTSLYRVFSMPGTKKLKVQSQPDWDIVKTVKEKLLIGIFGGQRFFQVTGEVVSKLKRGKNVKSLLVTSPAVDSTNLLNLMNVKYVVSIPKIDSPDYVLVHASDPIPEDPINRQKYEESTSLKIYENKAVLPRSFLVSACKIVNSEKEYKEILQSKSFNPKEILLLEKAPKGFPCDGKKAPAQQQPVRIDSYQSNELELFVQADERKLLFLSESYYPGWNAYINGEPAEILQANYLFRALVIEPGEHRVHFEYDPPSFKLGMVISLLTALVCGIFFFRKGTYRNILVEGSPS